MLEHAAAGRCAVAHEALPLADVAGAWVRAGRRTSRPGRRPDALTQTLALTLALPPTGCRSAALERRPAGLQPGDRHPERRAGDVVQADLVEEVHRVGVAAVLAADADLAGRAGSRGPPRRRSGPAGRRRRGRSTRTARRRRCPAPGSAEKNAPSTSSREKPQPIWVRSLVPKEKNSAASAIWPAVSAARGTSIIVPISVSTSAGPPRPRRAPARPRRGRSPAPAPRRPAAP